MTDTPEIPEHEAHRLRWVWYRSVVSQKIGAGNKVICWALADHINREKGIAWPSHDTLAAETGISARQVRNSLRFLEKEKLIAIKRRGGGIASDGTRRSCEYELQRLDEVKAHELRVAEARAKAKTKAKGSKPGNRLPGIADVPGNERSDNPETNGSKPGSLAHRDIPEISDNLTTDLTNNLNTDLSDQGQDSSGRVNFEGIDYSSTPDDPAWPDGDVAKAHNQKRAGQIVALEALSLLGYDHRALMVTPQRIAGQCPDEYIWQQFPPAALVQALTLCMKGTLRRRDLARALAALGIQKADDQPLQARAGGTS